MIEYRVKNKEYSWDRCDDDSISYSKFLKTIRLAITSGMQKELEGLDGQPNRIQVMAYEAGFHGTQIVIGHKLTSVAILSKQKGIQFTMMFTANGAESRYQASLYRNGTDVDLDLEKVCLVRIPSTRDISVIMADIWKLYVLFQEWDSIQDFEADQDLFILDYIRVRL